MAFTAKDVAALREQTGAGMMDCKKALVATDGDMEKAAEYLREQGVSVAAKKASRIASEGAVMAYTTPDGKTGGRGPKAVFSAHGAAGGAAGGQRHRECPFGAVEQRRL